MRIESDEEECPTLFQRFTSQVAVYSMWMVLVSLFPVLGWKSLKWVKPNNAVVKHRLGSKPSVRYSGVEIVLPVIDKIVEVNLSPQSLVLPSSVYYSKDRIPIDSGLIVEYQVKDPALCVCELQDVAESLQFAARTALPRAFSQNSSQMIVCSKKLLEYAVVKNISNAVSIWGIEIISAELSPFKFAATPDSEHDESPVSKAINFIQKIAGHNPLPSKDKLSIDEIMSCLKPMLTKKVCKAVNAVIVLKLVGTNGGMCLIDFKNCSMVKNPKNFHCDLTVEMTVDTFFDMFDLRDNIIDLYKSGKVAIDGDLSVAQRLQHMF